MINNLQDIIYNIKMPDTCQALKKSNILCSVINGVNLSLQKTIKIIIDFGNNPVNQNSLTILEQKIKAAITLNIDEKTPFKIVFIGEKIENFTIRTSTKIDLQGIFKPVPKVKKIIAVCSGKGGVGKSTITSNLAIKLMQGGKKVGILDADIYGASIPTIFGIENQEITIIDGKLEPIKKYDISLVSIGLLTHSDTPIIWRGPMLSKALYQMFRQTNWGDLDYLLVDTPPGTGDIHISLMQNYPIDGIILVSTNDRLSQLNTNKTATLFKNFGISTIGKIMNMSDIISDDANDCIAFNKKIIDGNNAGKPFTLNNDDVFCKNIISQLLL
jgi:ATP-binding protein involved in chromosome partitioning